jgi:hypothetical protein
MRTPPPIGVKHDHSSPEAVSTTLAAADLRRLAAVDATPA